MPSNRDRAVRAAETLRFYSTRLGQPEASEEDEQTLLVDLLTDLRHLARSLGVGYEDAVHQADLHFVAEVSGR